MLVDYYVKRQYSYTQKRHHTKMTNPDMKKQCLTTSAGSASTLIKNLACNKQK